MPLSAPSSKNPPTVGRSSWEDTLECDGATRLWSSPRVPRSRGDDVVGDDVSAVPMTQWGCRAVRWQCVACNGYNGKGERPEQRAKRNCYFLLVQNAARRGPASSLLCAHHHGWIGKWCRVLTGIVGCLTFKSSLVRAALSSLLPVCSLPVKRRAIRTNHDTRCGDRVQRLCGHDGVTLAGKDHCDERGLVRGDPVERDESCSGGVA